MDDAAAGPLQMPLAACTAAMASDADAWGLSDRAASRAADGEDIILLTVGDVDASTPEFVIDAAVCSLRAGRTHYAPIAGDAGLRMAAARSATARLNHLFSADNVVVFPGAQCALFSAMHCVAGPGEDVLLIEPSYATYGLTVAACGARAVRVPLSAAEGYRLDVERIASAITPRCRAIVINSPNNPCGAVFSARALSDLVALCLRHRIWILSDEVYAGLTFDGPHVSPASLPGGADCSVIIESLSKSHAMTGWRIGWALAPMVLRPHLEHLAQAQLFSSPPFIQDAAVAALEHASAITPILKHTFLERRDAFLEGLRACPQLLASAPQGGMFVLVDVSRTGLSAERFAAELLDEVGVAVIAGAAFGASAANSVRVALNQPVPRLLEACRRMQRFLKRRVR